MDDLRGRPDDPSTDPAGPGRQVETRTLYRHPLAAIGGALILTGVLGFVVLVVIDFFTPGDNPYRSLVTFIGLPALVLLGLLIFLLAVRIQVVRARRRGEQVRFLLRIEPSDPHYMRNLWLFLGLSGLFAMVVAFSGFKAYEATDSVAFCGETCHEVMGPQNVTYVNGPHARVPCVDCHIGPGGSFWVKSKVDGLRQVWAVTTGNFDRPIKTPVESLRPAQETCEGCHWPQQFLGEKLVTTHYYRTDEANSPWTISMLVNIGGGNPRTGRLEGIHWHMLTAQEVEYIATDDKREEITWVRVVDGTGAEVALYTDPGADVPDPADPDVEVRTFDCMDCHTRPSHHFLPPATAMNLEMAKGTISPELPFIRQAGLELLNAPYETTSEATAAISSGLYDFYVEEYPHRFEALRSDVERAIERLQQIYTENFFPEMATDYRARINNLSHFVNEGCFRCHFSDLRTETGEEISSGCDDCHTIVAQGPSDELSDLPSDINGLPFEHPVEIGGVWQSIRCTQCHTPVSGY